MCLGGGIAAVVVVRVEVLEGGLAIGVGSATQQRRMDLGLRERWWTADEARGWIRRTGA